MDFEVQYISKFLHYFTLHHTSCAFILLVTEYSSCYIKNDYNLVNTINEGGQRYKLQAIK